jgi:hypothetical protein
MVFEHDQHILIEDLSAYADGEVLSDDERARIEGHLRTCEECQSELDSIQTVSSLLADLPEPPLPRSFRLTPDDVDAVSGDSDRPEPVPIQPWIVRNQWYFRYAGLAAALLLVVVVSIDLLPGGDDSLDEVSITSEDADRDADFLDEEPAVMESDEEVADEPAMDTAQEEDQILDESVPESDPDSAESFEAQESEEAPVGDQDVVEDSAPMAEADRESVSEADRPDAEHPQASDANDRDHPLAGESVQEDADEDGFALPTLEADDDGLSMLQMTAIGLGVVAVAFLLLGFVVPRWWSASTRSR